MKRLIIFLFFCALVGTQYDIIRGVYWSDFFSVPLLFYALLNFGRIKKNYIAKISVAYSVILLVSGLLNSTLTDTVYLNFTRIFIEGSVAYVSLVIVLDTEKELSFFKWFFYIYSIVFLVLSATSLSHTMELDGSFETLDIQNGRNAMAVSNLLIVIMLSFVIFKSEMFIEKFFYLLFPFLIFNIIFSASRFSVISLALFAIFFLLWMRRKISIKTSIILLIMVATIPFLVESIMSRIDSGIMYYSSELLSDKIKNNDDGGFVYRIKDLNIDVIEKWLNDAPFYMWFLGDGISITHGIFSFTFCCTGMIGFLYFVVTHIKMIIKYWRQSSIRKYASFLIFIFFFNDIVTNSRFIICANTLLYMGMLAYLFSYDRVLNTNKNEIYYNTNRIPR